MITAQAWKYWMIKMDRMQLDKHIKTNRKTNQFYDLLDEVDDRFRQAESQGRYDEVHPYLYQRNTTIMDAFQRFWKSHHESHYWVSRFKALMDDQSWQRDREIIGQANRMCPVRPSPFERDRDVA